MIYHSLVDTTNIPKIADYIFSFIDKVVEEVGEENVVQVVTDNETSFKAAINETLDQAKMIAGFIYNSLKVVNLMKVFTKDRDLLRPGITRFAIEFISLESLIHYETYLKRMCTTNEGSSNHHGNSRQSIEIGDQDKKPTLSIIYEAMDRAKLAIKALVKQWEKYWEVIDRRETVHEDDGVTNRRVSRHTSNATQERDVDSRRKGKAPITISSSSSSDDGDNGGSRHGGGNSGGSRGVGGTGEGIGGDGSTGGVMLVK
ncbi:hypothetical protein CK203_056039 [Vitis vinifera]|uniref:DUF659 domain-containing protein n=1 Tax=Vitis vinifera TaxID=29760 RepID=A0A438GS72_VITVI|nr:hypothetical protein CK203_056039 [Vitis vinifera]